MSPFGDHLTLLNVYQAYLLARPFQLHGAPNVTSYDFWMLVAWSPLCIAVILVGKHLLRQKRTLRCALCDT